MKTVHLPISRQTLSHNLLTPLTGLLGNLSLLDQDKLSLTPEQKACFKDMSVSGERLLHFARFLIEQSQNNASSNH